MDVKTIFLIFANCYGNLLVLFLLAPNYNEQHFPNQTCNPPHGDALPTGLCFTEATSSTFVKHQGPADWIGTFVVMK